MAKVTVTKKAESIRRTTKIWSKLNSEPGWRKVSCSCHRQHYHIWSLFKVQSCIFKHIYTLNYDHGGVRLSSSATQLHHRSFEFHASLRKWPRSLKVQPNVPFIATEPSGVIRGDLPLITTRSRLRRDSTAYGQVLHYSALDTSQTSPGRASATKIDTDSRAACYHFVYRWSPRRQAEPCCHWQCTVEWVGAV